MFDLSELNDIVLCFNCFTGGKDSGFVEFQHDNFFSSVVVVGENVFLIPYSGGYRGSPSARQSFSLR
jgi:hypothetical protein